MRKVAVTALFALVLATCALSQQTAQSLAAERVSASAFEHAVQAEGSGHIKRIHKKRVQELCATDARGWGDGIMGYDRISFSSEKELSSKMQALVRTWKITGSQHPLFDASDFPKIRRYTVADCGVVNGQAKVVVAVYRSAWDTYWENWANLLGK